MYCSLAPKRLHRKPGISGGNGWRIQGSQSREAWATGEVAVKVQGLYLLALSTGNYKGICRLSRMYGFGKIFSPRPRHPDIQLMMLFLRAIVGYRDYRRNISGVGCMA